MEMETTPMEEEFTHGENKMKLREMEDEEGKELNMSSGESKSGSDRSTITSEHSHHDSDNDSCAHSPPPPSPPLSPPNKRPCQLRRLRDFNTPDELEMLESVAGEVVELKDYVEWFNSLGAEVDKDCILWPIYYCEWHKTLGAEVAVLDSEQYMEWYVAKYCKPQEFHFPDWPGVIERCAKLALTYFKGMNECDDYEYVRRVAIVDCPKSFHLNFYARRKVSDVSEPGPEELFFAEVDTEDNVMECCIINRDDYDYEDVQHPPNIDCNFCSGICLSHDCSE